MKLGILIPLKSKAVARNWDLTCDNLRKTLTSILNQSETNFVIVIIGHEKPEFLSDIFFRSKKIFFESLVEISPPVETDDDCLNQLLYEKDRCSKILKGIMFLRSISNEISYWFPLDADDLIHRDFVAEVTEIVRSKKVDAIILCKGFIYYKSSNALTKENDFSLYCGSSAIVADCFLPTVIQFSELSYQRFLFGEVPHTRMLDYFRKNQLSFYIPNKRLVMYCKDHGENISSYGKPRKDLRYIKRTLKIIIKRIYFSSAIRKDFSL